MDAVDISEVAVEQARNEADRRGLFVNWIVSDIDDFKRPSATYQVITVIRYRNPALWPRLAEALAPDGWILVEHHVKSERAVAGPSTPEFRLDPGELLAAFADLRIVQYAETIEPADLGGTHYAMARIVACNGSPGI